MNHPPPPGKYGALFVRMVAYGEHIIESLTGKLIDVFGTVTAYVDAQFAHHRHCFLMNRARAYSRTENLETVCCVVAQQTLSHLAASGVAGA